MKQNSDVRRCISAIWGLIYQQNKFLIRDGMLLCPPNLYVVREYLLDNRIEGEIINSDGEQ